MNELQTELIERAATRDMDADEWRIIMDAWLDSGSAITIRARVEMDYAMWQKPSKIACFS